MVEHRRAFKGLAHVKINLKLKIHFFSHLLVKHINKGPECQHYFHTGKAAAVCECEKFKALAGIQIQAHSKVQILVLSPQLLVSNRSNQQSGSFDPFQMVPWKNPELHTHTLTVSGHLLSVFLSTGFTCFQQSLPFPTFSPSYTPVC